MVIEVIVFGSLFVNLMDVFMQASLEQEINKNKSFYFWSHRAVLNREIFLFWCQRAMSIWEEETAHQRDDKRICVYL